MSQIIAQMSKKHSSKEQENCSNEQKYSSNEQNMKTKVHMSQKLQGVPRNMTVDKKL